MKPLESQVQERAAAGGRIAGAAGPAMGTSGTERAAEVRIVEIDEEGAGQRLDNLLITRLKGVPKSHLYRLIRSGQVRVNGARCAPDTRIEAGDRVRIPPLRVAEPAAGAVSEVGGAPPMEFPVIHEDDALLVIDKPAGIAVHGGSGVSSGVIERLRAARPQARRLELVHRLDRETSGVLLIAKKRSMLTLLQQQLRERRTDKRYQALVLGDWPARPVLLDSPLQRYLTAEGERRVAVDPEGQKALTRVRPLRRLVLPIAGAVSLVECRIETGRTHQIRVHLADAGHPIVGDEKYGRFELNKLLYKIGFKRMYLHAFSISVELPDGIRRFEAPLPRAFSDLLGPTG